MGDFWARVLAIRERSPKAFDLTLAVIAGMIIAYVMTR
jgi:hypothetical protein